MQKTHYKTIVVGAGPSGVSCGYTLKKSNEDCLLIDCEEFPREKLCGGGLTPKAHMLIDRVFDGVEYEHLSLKTISIYAKNKLVCDFTLSADVRIVVRKDFDNTLLNCYLKAGGEKITGRVSAISEANGLVSVTLRSGKTYTCSYLVGADGANSIVRKYLKPKRKKGIFLLEKTVQGPPGKELRVYFNQNFGKGYLYLFPNPRGYVVGFGSSITSVDLFDKVLDEHGLAVNEKPKGAYIPMFDKLNYPFKKNIMLVGDAGGYVDSMTGEGIYLAVKSGENSALAIINGLNFKQLNKSIIGLTKRRGLMAKAYFFPPISKLFMFMFKKRIMYSLLSKRVDRAFCHMY